jgi:hypothetical protein
MDEGTSTVLLFSASLLSGFDRPIVALRNGCAAQAITGVLKAANHVAIEAPIREVGVADQGIVETGRSIAGI